MENKYLRIYADLSRKIESGELKPQTKLPSEHELCELYQTSRETVRKALNLLAQQGYIQKIQGKGSIVLDIPRINFPVSGLVSFKELAEKMGREAETICHQLALIEPDAWLKEHLPVSSKDKVWKIIRSRKIDGEAMILDRDFIAAQHVPRLTKEICERSLYEYLEQDLGLKISFAKKVISIEEATAEDRRYLDLQGYDFIVLVKNYVYLDDATLFQYTESRHRPDKFQFVDFARRH
ncbi:trehalose operon repressor [Caldalkalibacillus thermarum]|nr:trehalose operon repressor [Caldalkalibacillus thermarum]